MTRAAPSPHSTMRRMMRGVARRVRGVRADVRRALSWLGRQLRRTTIARRAFDWVILHSYPPNAPGGWRASVAATILNNELAPRARRDNTVTLLSELFFDLVELLHVERFIEAGAKEASASSRAATVPAIRSVTAFEANPYTHRRFAPRLAGQRLQYEHLALAEATGQVSFHVMLTDDGRPTAHGQSSLLHRTNYAPGTKVVQVPATTLDDYFGPEPRASAMWVDVEGASSVVLRGGPRVLAETDVLIIEVEERPVWDGEHWLRHDIVEHLVSHGLIPVARDLQSRYQHNIVFVRSSSLRRADVRRRLSDWGDQIRNLDAF